jgi:hypothetical protein
MVFLQRRLAAIKIIATELATQYDALTRLRARVKRAEAAQSARRHRRKRPRDFGCPWRAVRVRHNPTTRF